MFCRNELRTIVIVCFPLSVAAIGCLESVDSGHQEGDLVTSVGVWTEWISVSSPQGAGGDFESRQAHDSHRLIPCSQPTNIECRVRETQQPAASTGQNFFLRANCSVDKGLVCFDSLQRNEDCLDYEVRYHCEYDDPFPNPEDNPDPAPTELAVGSLEGELTVDGNGQSNFRMSLRVPPGSGGVAPNLALAYQSGGSDGVLGKGWSLIGPSVISVSAATKHYNQTSAPITLSSDGHYDLDGRRLVKINTIDETTHYIDDYRTVVESRVRVRALRPKAEGSQPSHFIVTTGDQIRRVYGKDEGTQLSGEKGTLAWYMHRTEDASGNYIEYHYEDALLKTVSYTGNATANLLPYNHVEFLYERRPDVGVAYAAGMVARKQRVRLRKVRMRTGSDNYIREYRLTYDRSKLTGTSRLTSIQEVTGVNDGETLTGLPPTKFIWREDNKTPLRFETDFEIAGPTEEGFQVLAQGDFDGDGRPDFILGPVDEYGRIKSSSTTLHIYLSSEKYVAKKDLITLPTATYAGYERQIVTSGDFDGDGVTDLLLAYVNTKGIWQNRANPVFYFANAGAQFESVSWTPDPDSCVRKSPRLRGTGDFDGDGAIDLLMHHCLVTSNPGPRSKAVDMKTWKHDMPLAIKPAWKVYVAELNGDGKADVVVERTGEFCDARWVSIDTYINNGVKDIANGWNRVLETTKVETVSPRGGTRIVGIADFNSDGLSDVLLGRSSATDTWCQEDTKYSEFHLRPSQGDGTLADWSYTTKALKASIRVRGIGDFDGDGKGDFHAGDKVFAFNGEIFEERPVISLGDKEEIKIVGDLNKNGVADIVIASTDDKGRIVANTMLRPHLSQVGKPDEITSIVNGLNAVTEISYARLTDPDVYRKGEGAQYPQRNFDSPLSVVSEVRSDDGFTAMRTLRYKYANGIVDVSQQRFMGFESMETIDDVRKRTIVETFAQGFPCMGMLKQKEVRIDETVVRLEEHKPSYRTHKSGVGGQPTDCSDLSPDSLTTYNTYDRLQTETRWELDGEFWDTKTEEIEVDRFGNVTLKKTVFGDNSSEQIETKYEYFVDPTSWTWIPGRVLTRETVSKKDGDVHVRMVRYNEYWTTGWGEGRVKTETRDEDTNREVAAEYTYDRFGNISRTTLGGRLQGSYTFDAKGRFPTCTKNAAGHLEYREYSDVFGLETRVIQPDVMDQNGIKSCPSTPPSPSLASLEVEYDGFGRKTKELLPAVSGQERVVKSYEIEGQGDNGYRTIVTASGAPTQIRYFDRLEREISAATQRQVDLERGKKAWSVSLTEYGHFGRVTRKSNVFASDDPKGEDNDAKLWEVVGYDALDRVTKTTDFGNVVMTVDYDGNKEVTTIDADGKALKKTKISDSRGNVVEVEDDAGGLLILDYDAGGRLTKSTAMGSGKTVETRMEYDVAGNRTTLMDPNLGARTYEYDVHQQLTLQRDARGVETTMKYDSLGRMTERTSVEGVEEWIFDSFQGATALGKLMKETGAGVDPLRIRPSRVYGYDTLGRLTKMDSHVRGEKATIHHQYSDHGHVTRRSYSADGGSLYDVSYKYDDRGFLISAAGSDGQDWFFDTKYTVGGDVESYVDGAGSLTMKEYDETKGMVDVIDVENNNKLVVRTDLNYDSIGNLTKKYVQTGPNQAYRPILYGYDRLNRLTSGVKYDALGNITERGNQTFKYDPEHPHAVSQVGDISYSYDANGNMTRRGDAAGGTTFVQWSSFDKPTLMLRGDDYNIFEYDAGRRRVFQYTRETSVTGFDMFADGKDGSKSRWMRADNGAPCHVEVVSGGYRVYPKDGSGGCQLANTEEADWEFGPGSILQWNFQKFENPEVIVSIETTKGIRHLHYGWMAEDLGPGEDIFFTVTGAANKIQTVVRDLEADLKRAQPDADFVTILDFTVVSDMFITNIGSPHSENQFTRRRKEKFYWFEDLERTDFYGESCHVIPGITISCSTQWNHGAYLVRIAGPEATTLGSIAITEPHVGRRSYYHNDHLGSVIARTDDSGEVVERYAYDAWGAPRRHTVSGNVPQERWPDYGINDRGFTGHEMLGRAQLVHMNGRVYDPAIGRFLSPDPMVKGGFNLQAHNRYSYVLNNPLVNIDPSGHFWKKIEKFFKRTVRSIGKFFKRYGAAIVGAIAGFITGGWALAIAPLSWGSISTAIFVGAVSGFASGFTGALVGGQGLKAALKAGLTGSVVSGVLAGVQAAFVKWAYEKFTPQDKMNVEIYRVSGRKLDKTPLRFADIRGKSGDIFINGQSNDLTKAFNLALERVPSDDFYLIHNPTVSGRMDTIESILGKLTGSTPVSRNTARILDQFNLTNSHIYAHSQGGIITRNALVMNHRLGQDLAGLKVTFDGAAVNWASTSALFKTMGVSLPYRAFSAHPWDMVPNLTGYNALFPVINPYRLVTSILAAPAVFKGGAWSPHTHVGGGEAVRWAPQLMFRPQ